MFTPAQFDITPDPLAPQPEVAALHAARALRDALTAWRQRVRGTREDWMESAARHGTTIPEEGELDPALTGAIVALSELIRVVR